MWKPGKFVEGIEDTVVIHADQVPCWLRTGTLRQLYGNAEVRGKKKKHEVAVQGLSEPHGSRRSLRPMAA